VQRVATTHIHHSATQYKTPCILASQDGNVDAKVLETPPEEPLPLRPASPVAATSVALATRLDPCDAEPGSLDQEDAYLDSDSGAAADGGLGVVDDGAAADAAATVREQAECAAVNGRACEEEEALGGAGRHQDECAYAGLPDGVGDWLSALGDEPLDEAVRLPSLHTRARVCRSWVRARAHAAA
jgi:hypothetical protein